MKLPPTISLRLLPAALLLLYILIIGQDYLSSVLRDTGFFWPDVLLFNTYWLLFWPFARCWRGIEVKHPHKGGLLARIAAMLNSKCTVMKVFPIGELLFVSLFLVVACTGQKDLPAETGDRIVGGPFEMGEFIFYGMPEQIPAADTSPAWAITGAQKLLIRGRVLLADGVTPAPGVILYYYHTDTSGVYLRTKGMDQRAAPHGYIRGWLRSGAMGEYALYTILPTAYPNRTEAAHIHWSVKEPAIPNAYYIDNTVFSGDSLLTEAVLTKLPNRGGSGVVSLRFAGEMAVAERDITLGLNIPHYPENR